MQFCALRAYLITFLSDKLDYSFGLVKLLKSEKLI